LSSTLEKQSLKNSTLIAKEKMEHCFRTDVEDTFCRDAGHALGFISHWLSRQLELH